MNLSYHEALQGQHSLSFESGSDSIHAHSDQPEEVTVRSWIEPSDKIKSLRCRLASLAAEMEVENMELSIKGSKFSNIIHGLMLKARIRRFQKIESELSTQDRSLKEKDDVIGGDYSEQIMMLTRLQSQASDTVKLLLRSVSYELPLSKPEIDAMLARLEEKIDVTKSALIHTASRSKEETNSKAAHTW